MNRTRYSVAIVWAFVTLPSVFVPSVTHAEWTRFANHSDIRTLHEAGDTLWVGTGGGLVLVNALTGEVASTIDASAGLPSNSVRALYGRGGTVYVGTDGGLAVCRVRSGGISCEAAGSYPDVRHVSMGPSGTLYVGTFGRGVAEIRQGRAAWVTTADSLLDNKVYAVKETEAGNVFYATSMGLCARTSTAWVSYQAGAGVPRGEVRDMIDAAGRPGPGGSAGDFYVLVNGRGVYAFDGRQARRVSIPGFFRDDDVAGIAVAAGGTLWAAGRFGRLGRYRGGAWEGVGDDEAAIFGARWRCVHVGEKGIVYFGSADGVVAAADARGLRSISIPSGFPGGAVGSMALDATGRLYVVSGAYLLSREPGGSAFAVEKDFGSVLALAVSPEGEVWVIGRWGLYRKQADRWLEVARDIDPRPPLFRCLAFGASGEIWAGAETGEIFRFDGDLWLRRAGRDEFDGRAVDRVVVDRRETVWAVSGSEIRFWDGSDWARNEIGGIDSTGVVDFTVDPAGEPVLLTRGQLWRFSDGSSWGRVGTGARDVIGDHRAIAFDRRGTLYLATEKGIGIVGKGGVEWIEPQGGVWGAEATSVIAEGDRQLWVGFRQDGICRISLENP